MNYYKLHTFLSRFEYFRYKLFQYLIRYFQTMQIESPYSYILISSVIHEILPHITKILVLNLNMKSAQKFLQM